MCYFLGGLKRESLVKFVSLMFFSLINSSLLEKLPMGVELIILQCWNILVTL